MLFCTSFHDFTTIGSATDRGRSALRCSATSREVFTNIIYVSYPSSSSLAFCLNILSTSLPVPSMISPRRPSTKFFCFLAVTSFARPRTTSLGSVSSGGIFRDSPALFSICSNASSELTDLSPLPAVALPATYDFPLPGPPARKNALNILGSYRPSCSS